jgi:hypothetical protein
MRAEKRARFPHPLEALDVGARVGFFEPALFLRRLADDRDCAWRIA